MRTLAIIVAAIAVLLGPTAAHAQGCAPGVVRQDDMAGVYADPVAMMRVEVYACGGIYVQWDNQYGTHAAAYGTDARVPQGGVTATVLPNMGVPLDGSRRLGVKPAEVGYVQVITLGVYDDTYRAYRLKKIG